MNYVDRIVSLASAFEIKTSAVNIQQYAKNIQYAINLEASTGLKVVNNLLKSNPNSTGLRIFKSIFTELLNSTKELNSDSVYSINGMLATVNKGNFLAANPMQV